MLHPITFSIPEEKVISHVPQKTKILAHIIPGKLDTYIFNNEADYYTDYRQSMFAMTTKKAGWDCMRHYEILANGTIPFFPDIEECPPNTMFLYPKKLQLQGNKMYEKLKQKDFDELTVKEMAEYYKLASRFLMHTKAFLTTTNLAKYILMQTNNINVNSVLYLSEDMNPDYLRCLTLHGFKTIFGDSCHDYPKVQHLYKSDIDYASSPHYGRGFTYSKLLDNSLHKSTNDASIEEDIKSKKYDIVIYGSYHRGMPYYDLVMSIYDPVDVIIMCGEDEHQCSHNDFIRKGHHFFLREL
jgi:hypothetical protein